MGWNGDPQNQRPAVANEDLWATEEQQLKEAIRCSIEEQQKYAVPPPPDTDEEIRMAIRMSLGEDLDLPKSIVEMQTESVFKPSQDEAKIRLRRCPFDFAQCNISIADWMKKRFPQKHANDLFVHLNSNNICRKPVSQKPITKDKLDELNGLLFGNVINEDVLRWHQQNFSFSTKQTSSFGLIQNYGGPCGVLASVQAYVLLNLIFGPKKEVPIDRKCSNDKEKKYNSETCCDKKEFNKKVIYPTINMYPDMDHQTLAKFSPIINPNDMPEPEECLHQIGSIEVGLDNKHHLLIKQIPEENCWKSLCEALALMIYQSTPNSKYYLFHFGKNLDNEQDETKKEDNSNNQSAHSKIDLPKTGTILEFNRIDAYLAFLWDHRGGLLQCPANVIMKCPVVAFVFSILLTRTLQRVREDMDDANIALTGQFGYCCQELVNLCMCGEAVTNVFDNSHVLTSKNDAAASTVELKGISSATCCGLLSTLEPLNLCEVGNFYKFPTFPIWVVGGASHYSTLFAVNSNVSVLSHRTKTLMNVSKAFNEFDADRGGFITFKNLPQLLKNLGMQYLEAAAKLYCLKKDSDIILWQTFWQWVSNVNNLNESKENHSRIHLFYYDGQVPPGPTLMPIEIEVSDLDSTAFVQNSVVPMLRLLHTRWPNCLVVNLEDLEYMRCV